MLDGFAVTMWTSVMSLDPTVQAHDGAFAFGADIRAHAKDVIAGARRRS